MLKGLDINPTESQLETSAEAPTDIDDISYNEISINDEQSSLDEPINLSEHLEPSAQDEPSKTKTKNKTDKQSRLDALILRKQKLESTLKEIDEKRKKVEKSISETAKTASRKKITRFKTHAGGIIKMVGLLDYEYDAPYEDNPQDRLAANLIVGVLLEAAQRLSSASLYQLQNYFDTGRKYRSEKIKSRPIPHRNPQFEEFCKRLIAESKITIHKPKEKESTND